MAWHGDALPLLSGHVLARGLSAFAVVTFSLILATAACSPLQGSGGNSTQQTAAEAQATNVRRTAVAEVQRIIANNPQPTTTPNPTALPRPTCQDAIWWHQARTHLGEVRTVQGTVTATRGAPDGLNLLEVGQPFPDPTGIVVLLPQSTTEYLGKAICVSGRLNSMEGIPMIQLRDGAAIRVMN